jgi:hypothetical protein
VLIIYPTPIIIMFIMTLILKDNNKHSIILIKTLSKILIHLIEILITLIINSYNNSKIDKMDFNKSYKITNKIKLKPFSQLTTIIIRISPIKITPQIIILKEYLTLPETIKVTLKIVSAKKIFI